MKTRSRTIAVVAASAVTTSLMLGAVPSAGSTGATRAGSPDRPVVVKLKSTDHKVKTSDARIRPGVTEFRISDVPSRRSSIVVVQSDDLQRAFTLLGTAFSGGPGSADAQKKFDRIVTIYGGGGAGTRWQVKLGQGKYYVLDTDTNNMTTLKVTGERRSARMARADSTIITTKDNQFSTSGQLDGPWVGFENNSREMHFIDAIPVAERVTGKDVRAALDSPKEPKWFRPGGWFFDVQSPGVKTVYRQDVRASKYLLICFMQSEEHDGMPHAMMGMWKLVHGG